MVKLRTLNDEEKGELAHHEKFIADLLKIAREDLAEHSINVSTPRWQELLYRLEEAFRKRTCPPDIDLLLAGLAEDDYLPPKVREYINARDMTPRNYWQSISPELLRACEDGLFYVEPLAFCYLLPAYLRVCIQRSRYLFHDSVFFLLCYDPADRGAKRLAPLSAAERAVVTDIVNERRCEALFDEKDLFEAELLPWEYEQMLAENPAADKHDRYHFAERMATEYAERTGYLG